jgi:hypothetical protein
MIVTSSNGSSCRVYAEYDVVFGVELPELGADANGEVGGERALLLDDILLCAVSQDDDSALEDANGEA